MANDKSRSVVTDFGGPSAQQPARPKKPSGKQASRDKRTDAPEPQATKPAAATPAPAVAAPTEPVRRKKPRTPTMKMPGAAVAGAHFAGAEKAKPQPTVERRSVSSSKLQVHDEILVAKDERLHLINEPDSDQSSGYRVLRHQIEAAGRPQVIAVSSPNEGEGKTTTATNLALALAECGRARVLLVEANYRAPALARMFKITPQACFADQVDRFHASPSAAWHVTSLGACYLHLLPLGRGRAPSPLLDGPAFRSAIEALREVDYDHIVIDCSSVLAGADVNLVQDVADGVLLVARARQTTGRDIRASLERLTPSNLLGTVLIGG